MQDEIHHVFFAAASELDFLQTTEQLRPWLVPACVSAANCSKAKSSTLRRAS